MIADQVEINKLYHFADIEAWCEAHLGPQAPTTDTVDENRPWLRQWNYGNTVWFFATVEAATMFRLRWL